MFIKCDFSNRIIDLKPLVNIDLPIKPCCHIVFYIKNNSGLIFWYLDSILLLDSIEGFLFRCKSVLFQPSHSVSGLMFQNNFDKNKKSSSPTICLE